MRRHLVLLVWGPVDQNKLEAPGGEEDSMDRTRLLFVRSLGQVALRRIKSQVDPRTRSRRFRHKIVLFLDRTKNKVDQSFGNCPVKLFLAKQHDVNAGEIR